MPGSAFDASGPPDGDYTRYIERLGAADATATRPHREPAEHAWGHAADEERCDSPAVGLDACPGPSPGFGFQRAGAATAATATTLARAARLPGAAAVPDTARPRPRRLRDVLSVALILAGGAQIALVALPPEPWFSTPLPGFLLLAAGLHLRRRSRRRRLPPNAT